MMDTKYNFPIFKTKVSGVTQRFDLNDPEGRREYFRRKAGPEIERLKKYLEKNTFVGFLIGKKNSGKGTYSKLFMEAVEMGDRVGHLSVGDLVRDVHRAYKTGEGRNELVSFLQKNYRGFHNLEEIENIILGRDTSTLVSSEVILALIKYEISRRPRQAIFIDGFPRALDQVGYSLVLKELIGYRDDPDFLVFIDVPETVIDARIKSRRVCPRCHNPRNIKLLPTKYIGYDKVTNEFYLMCDDPKCDKAVMTQKEGDELGIEPIRERLQVDDKIFKQLLALTGIPKIYLRNSLPADRAFEYVDEYEVTPMYDYEYDEASRTVRVQERPWVIADEHGVPSHSLLSAPVALGLIKQVAEIVVP